LDLSAKACLVFNKRHSLTTTSAKPFDKLILMASFFLLQQKKASGVLNSGEDTHSFFVSPTALRSYYVNAIFSFIADFL